MSDFSRLTSDAAFIENIKRRIYENSAEIWPHLKREEWPLVPAIVGSRAGRNPFAADDGRSLPPSRSFTGHDAVRLYEAAAFTMWSFGLAFNGHLTILWRGLGIVDHARAAAVLSAFNKEAAAWLRVGELESDRRRMNKRAAFGSSPHVYAYVHENTQVNGFHTHQLLYVPREKAAAFEVWAEKCLTRLSGRRRAEVYAVHLSPRTKKGGFLPRRYSTDASAAADMWRWVRYVMKGLPEEWFCVSPDAPAVKLREIFAPRPFYPSAPVYARRVVGFSENIGPAAQRAAGFESKYRWREFDRLYDGSELADYRREVARAEAAAELDEAMRRMKL